MKLSHSKSVALPSDAQVAECTPTATRHIILIRHGQYNSRGDSDETRDLTDLGQIQARITGERIRELGYPLKVLLASTMARARQTAKLIGEQLTDVPYLGI